MATALARTPCTGAHRARRRGPKQPTVAAAPADAIPRAGPSHNSSQHNPHHPQYQHQLQQRRESSQLSSTSDAGGLTRSQDAALSGAEGAHSSSACHVTFWLQYQAAFGQRISVVGSTESLGGWVLRNGAELEWGEGHRWSVTVEVPAGGIVEYKYVVLQPDGIQALQWQEGNNAVLAIMVRHHLPRLARPGCHHVAATGCPQLPSCAPRG